jgi:hypothetical protein
VNSHDFPWILFAVQQFTVPLLSVAATGLLTAALVSVIPESTSAWDIAGVITYISPGLFGFTFGVLARSLGPAVKQAGSWIWVVPGSTFTVAFLVTLLSNWRQALPEFFGIRGGATEEGLIALLVTFPTLACCFYAVGINVRRSTQSES